MFYNCQMLHLIVRNNPVISVSNTVVIHNMFDVIGTDTRNYYFTIALPF